MPRRRRYFLVPASHTLDPRLIPSAFFAPPGSIGSDPLPSPEPSPGTDPGSSVPITPPPIPASGPIGPGTS